MEKISKYAMIVVAIGSVIIVPIVFFSVIGNDDGNILLPLLNSKNQDGTTQQIDEAYLRGAVDADSEGKQITEENKRNLCRLSAMQAYH